MKRKNGDGTVVKLSGNRRRPWACRKIIGWKEDGKPVIRYISYHKTKRQAEIALNQYNADPYSLANKYTLDDLYKEWYSIQENEKAEQTLRAYRIRYGHLKAIHEMKLTDIDVFTLESLYKSLDVSKGTLEDVQTLVNLMFKYAVKRKYLPVTSLNLSKSINMPVKKEIKQNPHSVISKEDIDRLWTVQPYNEYAKIILVYIYTGMRYSELKNLDPADCHDNYVEIRQAKTPSGKRIVPICSKIQAILPIIPVPARTTFDRYFKELLPNHNPHDTRHTFTSMMTEKNVDVRVLKAILGHRLPDVTAIYTHISLDMMLDAVNLL